jgi:hypothetical protein
MEALKSFLKIPLVLSLMSVLLILAALFDVIGVKFLFIKVKLVFGVFMIAVFLILEGISSLKDDD